ncbi:MAG TPA: preprotein translocase subunit YajC [Pseudolysinimonas sp.]
MSFAPTIVHAADAPASGGFLSDNFLTIGLVAVLAIMIIFMFRNSRKRRRDAEEMKDKFVPGAEVMTQHGIFGTIVSIDDEKNEAVIETTPGTKLRVHRQTISRVIDPVEAQEDVVADEPAKPSINESRAIPAGEPQYGERTVVSDGDKPKRAPRKKAGE